MFDPVRNGEHGDKGLAPVGDIEHEPRPWASHGVRGPGNTGDAGPERTANDLWPRLSPFRVLYFEESKNIPKHQDSTYLLMHRMTVRLKKAQRPLDTPQLGRRAGIYHAWRGSWRALLAIRSCFNNNRQPLDIKTYFSSIRKIDAECYYSPLFL